MSTQTKITTADEARTVADEIVTLLQSITRLEAEKEAEKNAIDAKFATLRKPQEERAKELQKAFQTYLKKKGAQEELFDEGNRSGSSTLAVFGYRDTPPSLVALGGGKVADVAAALHDKGKAEFVLVEQPKISLNIPAIKAANLGTGALADLGLCWKTTTKFFIELKNKAVTATKTATA